jgi:hypothetical protein
MLNPDLLVWIWVVWSTFGGVESSLTSVSANNATEIHLSTSVVIWPDSEKIGGSEKRNFFLSDALSSECKWIMKNKICKTT